MNLKSLVAVVAGALWALAPAPAAAQSTKKLNCLTKKCLVVSDPYPVTVKQPASCSLFVNGAFKLSAAVADGLEGRKFCSFPDQSFPAGSVSLTASATAADGEESDLSAPFAFFNTEGPPSAPVLRVNRQ